MLVAHGAHAVDMKPLYACLLAAKLLAHQLLVDAGVLLVLDSLKFARLLPPAVTATFELTATGKPSFSNGAVARALAPSATAQAEEHLASDDTEMTVAWLRSAPAVALLQSLAASPAIASLDQLVLMMHKQVRHSGLGVASGLG